MLGLFHILKDRIFHRLKCMQKGTLSSFTVNNYNYFTNIWTKSSEFSLTICLNTIASTNQLSFLLSIFLNELYVLLLA